MSSWAAGGLHTWGYLQGSAPVSCQQKHLAVQLRYLALVLSSARVHRAHGKKGNSAQQARYLNGQISPPEVDLKVSYIEQKKVAYRSRDVSRLFSAA